MGESMLENAITTLNRVYSKLEDEESRKIFIDLLKYRITGDDGYWMDFVERYYKGVGRFTRQALVDFINCLPKDGGIVLYGAGKECSLYFDIWRKTGRIVAICDKNACAMRYEYYGIPVISPERLREDKSRIVVIVSYKYRMEILHDLDKIEYPIENIYTTPFLGEEVDDVGQYFDPQIIRYTEDEVFVDGGCLNLNTSLELRKRIPNVTVHAFEPSSQNYARCMEIKDRENFINATIYPYGLWSCNTELRFNDRGNGMSNISEDGEESIHAVALDEIIPHANVTFIKMDLEGAEVEAIKGAKAIIQKNRPKMAISLYHKLDDIITIPSIIMDYVDDYRYYIRCYKNEWREVVLYAVPS